MFTFEDIISEAQQIECEPFVYRVGCFECIRQIEQYPLRYANDVPRHSITGCVTNQYCDFVGHAWFVQACLWRKDTKSQAAGWGYGGKIVVSPHMAYGELVKKFLVAALGYAEHEVREAFKWKGRRIAGPHISIEALWEIAERTENR